MFVHLHGHDHYSLLKGLGSPGDIVSKAKSLGMSSIAITGYEGMYGMVEFYQETQDTDIKPIIGLEISIVDDISIKKRPIKRPNYITLLAENYKGYKNLMQLSSIGNLDGFYKRARIDYSSLKKYSDGLIGFMGGSKSQVGSMILSNDNKAQIKERLKFYVDVLGEDKFFLEIIAQKYNKLKDLKKVNTKVYDIAQSMDIDLITNNNFHYISKDQKDAYETLLCIKNDNKIYNSNHPKVNGDYHIFTEKEMKDTLTSIGYDLDQIQNMFDNNQKIADSIDVKIPLGSKLFPKYDSPEHIQEIYAKHKDNLVQDGE